MRLGIFPGTFNPVHSGHLKALQAVAREYGLQRILVIPAGHTPNKGIISSSKAEERWNLLCKAFQACTDVSISLFAQEINEQECSYTSDTIAIIKKHFPSDVLFLMIGEDNLASLPHWYNADYILSNVRLIVLKRDIATSTQYPILPVHTQLSFTEFISEASSTAIRESMINSVKGTSMLTMDCEETAYAFGLYLPQRIQDEIRFVKAHQKAKRFKHTVGVVRTALSLSSRFAIDPLSVLESAYLHDIAKELPGDLMICLASESNTDLGFTDIDAVLHAPAGAELAKLLFDIDQNIYNAILRHCTLDAQMTLLDKIIFISDMVEPSRSYPSVNLLREKFDTVTDENELNSLLVLAIKMNFCYISSTGGMIHPASMRALSALQNFMHKENLWNLPKQS